MRIQGKVAEDGSYQVWHGDRLLKSIPADEVKGHKKLDKAIKRNGWEKPE